MKHIKTLNTRKLQNTVKKGGCGECQTSCQSAMQDFLYCRKPDLRALQIITREFRIEIRTKPTVQPARTFVRYSYVR